MCRNSMCLLNFITRTVSENKSTVELYKNFIALFGTILYVVKVYYDM